MTHSAKLHYDDKTVELPIITGSENERAVDIRALRGTTGLVTLDDGYGNTGACLSNITFIDGEQGVLRYRGYPIEELADKSTFVETAYLLIFGELPSESQLAEFRRLLTRHQFIHEDMRHHFDGFPPTAAPMAILSAMVNAAGCFQPELRQPEEDDKVMEAAARIMKIGRAHV